MLDVCEELSVAPVSTGRAVPSKKRTGRPKKYKNPAARTKAWRQRVAENRPPTTPEPEYPTLTGDPQVDRKLIDAYRRKVAQLQAEWDKYLNQNSASSLNRGDEHDLFVTGGYDLGKLDKIDSVQKLGVTADRLEQGDFDFKYRLGKESPDDAV
jgi:hypothetical protein